MQVSAAPEENKLRSREQVVRAESRHVSTSLLGTMLTILSRPKLSLSLQLESVQYQMDSYFEVPRLARLSSYIAPLPPLLNICFLEYELAPRSAVGTAQVSEPCYEELE